MLTLRRGGVCLLLVVAIGYQPSAARASAAPADAEVRALVNSVNQHRRAIGCRGLVWDERLARVARAHSEAMARQGFFGHVDPAGRDPFDRLEKAGISFRAAAENIAAGQTSAREVYADWMKSRSHRRNLEDCEYTHHGIGVYRNHWTHLFARY